MGQILIRRLVSETGHVVGAYAKRLDPEPEQDAEEPLPAGLSEDDELKLLAQRIMERDFELGAPRIYTSLKRAIDDPSVRRHEVVYGEDLHVRALSREAN